MKHICTYESFSVESDLTHTENFKRWFRDSKIVDRTGAPLVVYHGTGVKFDTFRTDTVTKNYTARFGDGFYFTELLANASGYMDDSIGHDDERCVLKVYLSLQNPLIINEGGRKEYLEIITGERERQLVGVRGPRTEEIRKKTETQLAIELGYDGVIFMWKGAMNEIIAFRPNQIKSVENNGNFDLGSASMLE